MAYQKAEEQKDLRKRVLKIAASYVGQSTYGTRTGFNDPDFDSKMRGIGFNTGDHWCNWFTRLVYKEALTKGNNYVNSTTSYPNNWENTTKGQYLKPPVESTKSGIKINSWANANKYGLQTYNTEYTSNNYIKVNRYISITNNPSRDRSIGASDKNLGTSSNFKKYVEGGYILPGDAILFDWGAKDERKDKTYGEIGEANAGDWNYSKLLRFTDHIGIYLAPANSSYSKVLTIEGNFTVGGVNGVWIHERSISVINGFGQLSSRVTI